MSNDNLNERLLLRLLAGELSAPEARRLERRVAQDPELGARYERLRASWETLEPGPAPGVPEGFRDGVMTAARSLAGGEISWSMAPVWARAGAAAALLLGLAAGMSFGRGPAPGGGPEAAELDAYLAAEFDARPVSLSETYWLELEEGGGELLEGGVP